MNTTIAVSLVAVYIYIYIKNLQNINHGIQSKQNAKLGLLKNNIKLSKDSFKTRMFSYGF